MSDPVTVGTICWGLPRAKDRGRMPLPQTGCGRVAPTDLYVRVSFRWRLRGPWFAGREMIENKTDKQFEAFPAGFRPWRRLRLPANAAASGSRLVMRRSAAGVTRC